MSETALLILVLQLGLSLLLGGVFLAAALPKLRHPKGFLLTVLEYRLLPEGASRLYARLLPPLELLVALLLFAGVAARLTALLLALLTVSFLIGVGVNVARGRDLDCGCFGQGKGASRRIGPGVLLQDAGLLAAALVLAATTPQWLGAAPWSLTWPLARLSSAPVAGPLVFLACVGSTVGITFTLERAGPSRGRTAGRKTGRGRVGGPSGIRWPPRRSRASQ